MFERAVIAVALGALWACPVASAADFTVDGADKSQAIALEPCLPGKVDPKVAAHEDEYDKILRQRRCGNGEHAADAIGRLTLIVRNGQDKPLRLRLRYARSDGLVATMPGNSHAARLLIARPPSRKFLNAIDGDTDAVAALARLPTGEPQDRPGVAKLLAHPPAKPSRSELNRLAAAFTLLVSRPGSNAVLTRSDALDLLGRFRKARSHETSLKPLLERAFAIAVARSVVVVPPNSASALPVRFLLPGRRPASLLAGVLQVRELSPGSAVVTVPVAAAEPDAKSVTAMPAAITLTTARSRKAHIDVIGPGVSGLVVAAHGRHSATLRNDDGNEAKITIDPFTRDGANRNRASALVTVDKGAKPGVYKGDIALFGSTSDGPKLSVTVREGWPEWQALLVMAGVLLVVLVLIAALGRAKRGPLIIAALLAAAIVVVLFHFKIYGPTWGSMTDVGLAIALAAGAAAFFCLLAASPQRRQPYRQRRR